MLSHRARAILLLATGAAACKDEGSRIVDPSPPMASEAAGARITTVSGTLNGPDSTTLCNFIPPGSLLRVRLIRQGGNVIAGSQDLICPESAYSIPMDTGSFLLRLQLPNDPGIGNLPSRHLETTPIVVGRRGITRNVTVLPGLGLGGGATLDGHPIEGFAISLAYGLLPGFAAAFGVSGPDGLWDDSFGRDPLVLQGDVDIQVATGCTGLLGALALEPFPVGPFRFPTERDAVSCAMQTGTIGSFTHNLGRLAVSPLAGDIGGRSPETIPQFGEGYGALFPRNPRESLTPTNSLSPFSHLFRGGLLVGLANGQVLSGTSVAGEMECGASCRDLGLDGALTVFTTPTGKKTVEWVYSDAASPDGAGLQVTQRSFDPQFAGDYVLFRFTLRNTGPAPLGFSSGVFLDLDVKGSASDDLGFIDQGGRLMYQTKADQPDVQVGTLLVGDGSVSGGFFYTNQLVPPLGVQLAALDGSLTESPPPTPADYRYIQGQRSLTLPPGGSTDLWMAVVAGEDPAGFAASVAGATRDIDVRRPGPRAAAAAGTTETATVTMSLRVDPARSGPRSGAAQGKPSCGAGCRIE